MVYLFIVCKSLILLLARFSKHQYQGGILAEYILVNRVVVGIGVAAGLMLGDGFPTVVVSTSPLESVGTGMPLTSTCTSGVDGTGVVVMMLPLESVGGIALGGKLEAPGSVGDEAVGGMPDGPPPCGDPSMT